MSDPVAQDDSREWCVADVRVLFELPFNDLVFRAHETHRRHFDPNRIQLSTLLNIKSGGCPEDCAYCPQSTRYDTGVAAEGLLDVESVASAARRARASGATRFCMGAAWRGPKDRDLARVAELIRAVKAEGLESCATLGLLSREQAQSLRDAGLDYYNHNLDTSESYYSRVITTRTYQDRLETLRHVRDAGMRVCCGGIIGMGETLADRCGLIATLAALPEPPESVPINVLVRVAGTPLADVPPLDPLDLVRTIAVARIAMPSSFVRLSAGRNELTDELQAWCFFAGANSIFYGEHLLTTDNPAVARDQALFARLGLEGMH